MSLHLPPPRTTTTTTTPTHHLPHPATPIGSRQSSACGRMHSTHCSAHSTPFRAMGSCDGSTPSRTPSSGMMGTPCPASPAGYPSWSSLEARGSTQLLINADGTPHLPLSPDPLCPPSEPGCLGAAGGPPAGMIMAHGTLPCSPTARALTTPTSSAPLPCSPTAPAPLGPASSWRALAESRFFWARRQVQQGVPAAAAAAAGHIHTGDSPVLPQRAALRWYLATRFVLAQVRGHRALRVLSGEAPPSSTPRQEGHDVGQQGDPGDRLFAAVQVVMVPGVWDILAARGSAGVASGGGVYEVPLQRPPALPLSGRGGAKRSEGVRDLLRRRAGNELYITGAQLFKW